MEMINGVIKKGVKLIISFFEGNNGIKYAKYLSSTVDFTTLIGKLSEELISYFNNEYKMSLD